MLSKQIRPTGSLMRSVSAMLSNAIEDAAYTHDVETGLFAASKRAELEQAA